MKKINLLDTDQFKILSCQEVVKQMLIKYPKLRDNDNRLLGKIWEFECYHKQIKPKNLFVMVRTNQLMSAKSIFRSRRHLQKKYPELRGKIYEVRKGILEPQVRKEIIQDYD